MSKRMTWRARGIYLGVAFALALGLLISPAPGNIDQADADPGLSRWTKIATRDLNDPNNWAIAWDSDIFDFAVGPDGNRIYTIGRGWKDADRDGVIDRGEVVAKLWRSTNGGASFIDKTKELQEADGLAGDFISLDAVAVAPDDEKFLVVTGMIDTTGDGVGDTPALVISDDGCATFTSAEFEDIAGVTQVGYRCLAISKEYGDELRVIAAGTVTGQVFVAVVGGITVGWKEASDAAEYPGWRASTAVTSLIFSPAYGTDKTLLVISNTATASYLQALKWGVHKEWNSSAVYSGFPVKIDDIVAELSDMALPSDYMGGSGATRNVFAILTGYVTDRDDDDFDKVVSRVYRIENYSVVAPCNPSGDPLLASIAYNGTLDDGKAMVGQLGSSWTVTAGVPDPQPVARACCSGLYVYRTTEITDCCPKWYKSIKLPTGQLMALVAYTPDGDKAYCTSKGDVDAAGDSLGHCDESAFSVSLSDGKMWNQLSLIDTDIEYLSDVIVSPDCNVTYVSSVNVLEAGEVCECDSVWRLEEEADAYAGVWQRVWSKTLNGAPEAGLLRLAADADDGVYVVLGDRTTENIYVSSNSGDFWSTKSTSLDVGDFAVETAEVIYVLDDGGDCIAKSTDNGWTWDEKVDTKVTKGHTITVLPGGHVLVGPEAGGKVAYSTDGGETFSRTAKLKDSNSDAAGDAHVAFDAKYADNSIIYAAVGGPLGYGIYRWVVGESSEWKDLKAYGVDGAAGTADDSYYGIAVANEGTLYGAYDGGVARTLTPTAEKCCWKVDWDYMVKPDAAPKDFTAEPSSLRICGCLTKATNSKLWAIDMTNDMNNDAYSKYGVTPALGHLYVYEDCFAKAGPTVISPASGTVIPSDPCDCFSDPFTIKWDRLCNACEYDIQFLNADFSAFSLFKAYYGARAPDLFILKPESPSVLIPLAALQCGKTYKWRIRVRVSDYDDAVRSPWSALRTISVELGPGPWPGSSWIDLSAPVDGGAGVAIKNVGFTWSTVPSADSYDFVLSKKADLTSPLESKTGLKGTGYVYAGTLDYETPYFWLVTAKKGATVLSTSSVSTFTTMAKAVEPPPPVKVVTAPPPTTPAWVWVVIAIGAVLVIVVIVLIFRTRRV